MPGYPLPLRFKRNLTVNDLQPSFLYKGKMGTAVSGFMLINKYTRQDQLVKMM